MWDGAREPEAKAERERKRGRRKETSIQRKERSMGLVLLLKGDERKGEKEIKEYNSRDISTPQRSSAKHTLAQEVRQRKYFCI